MEVCNDDWSCSVSQADVGYIGVGLSSTGCTEPLDQGALRLEEVESLGGEAGAMEVEPASTPGLALYRRVITRQ